MSARKAERLRWRKPKRPPLPRAVRELLRDVVLLEEAARLTSGAQRPLTLPFELPNQYTIGRRAAKILGTTPGAIVARARKVRK